MTMNVRVIPVLNLQHFKDIITRVLINCMIELTEILESFILLLYEATLICFNAYNIYNNYFSLTEVLILDEMLEVYFQLFIDYDDILVYSFFN